MFYMHIYIHIIYIYIYICIHSTHIHIYIYIYSICICVHVCIYIYIYIHIVYVCVYKYIYIYIHTHKRVSALPYYHILQPNIIAYVLFLFLRAFRARPPGGGGTQLQTATIDTTSATALPLLLAHSVKCH